MKLMLKYLFLICIMGIVFLFTNCGCPKRSCLDGANFFSLYNFSDGDASEVIFKSFEQGTNFSKVIDSTKEFDNKYYKGAPSYSIFASGFSIQKDWEIILPKINRTYKLSNFTFSKEVCDRCFLTTNYYTSLESYQLDGKTIKSHFIEIYK